MLVFVVETAGKPAAAVGSKSKIDYRDVLSETDFAVFCLLRDKRMELSDAEQVPVYAISSNAHLGSHRERGISPRTLRLCVTSMRTARAVFKRNVIRHDHIRFHAQARSPQRGNA